MQIYQSQSGSSGTSYYTVCFCTYLGEKGDNSVVRCARATGVSIGASITGSRGKHAIAGGADSCPDERTVAIIDLYEALPRADISKSIRISPVFRPALILAV